MVNTQFSMAQRVQVLSTQCLWARRVCLGEKVKRQGIEGNPIQGDKILKEEDII